jgi:hypothetical protein
MQACDVDGKLIMTACVWVWFTLDKYLFRDDNNRQQQRDTFIAEIDSIQAITRPDVVTTDVTPHSSPKTRKRKIVYRTDPHSPSKGKGKGKD